MPKNGNGRSYTAVVEMIDRRLDRLENKVDKVSDNHSNLKAKVYGLAATISTVASFLVNYLLK